MIKRPILAEKIEPSELENLKYPVLVSPKLDGIRCLIVDGKALSRSFKPIPNLFIQSLLSKQEFNGLDGELVLEGKTFNETQSIVMSESSEPALNLTFLAGLLFCAAISVAFSLLFIFLKFYISLIVVS